MAGTKGRRSPHIVRPGRNRHRILSSIGAAVLLGALAVSGVMPAGADGEDPPPEQTLAEAPPEDLPAPPETTAPPTTTAPPEDPPPPPAPETTAPPTTAPPADPPPPIEDPPELLSTTSFDVGVMATETIQYTGQGTTNGVCDGPFEDPADSPVTFDPATQLVWQFNLTGLANPQPAGFPRLTYVFTSGPSASQVTPPDTFTGGVAKWFVVTPKNATLNNFPDTFAEGEKNNPNASSQLTISHCWGENDAEVGSLDVAKVVDGSGSPAPGAEFTIDVDCDDDGFDRTLVFDATGALDSGGPLPISDIPVGTECTVDETGEGGADAVAYDPDPPTVTITTAGETVTVTVTNTFDEPEVGSLDVDKSVVGPVPGGAAFTIDVDCDDDGFDRTLVFDATGALDSGGPLPISDIPVGTECAVEESGDGGADSVDYEVDGVPVQNPPPTVTIESDAQTVTVTVTNTFDEPEVGSISVVKETAGEVGDGTTFEVEVACDGLDPVVLTFTTPGDLAPKSVDDIPTGTDCTVEETQSSGATLVIYDPAGGTEQDPPTVTVGDAVQLVTVTNFFPGGAATGSVEVTKAVEGSPPEGATYDVRVFCTDGTDHTLQFAAGGGTQTVTGIQIPASCTVEETGQGGSSSVTYTPDDTTFSLTVQTPERDLTVTNIFDPQTITGVGGASAVRTVVRAPTSTLAFTGSPIADLVKVAVWLLVIGSMLCLVVRRRAGRASG